MTNPRVPGIPMFGRPKSRRRRAPATRRRLGGEGLWHAAAHEALEQRLVLSVDIQVRFEFADPQGGVIDTLHPGDDFLLKTYVQDIRDEPKGIFQAYFDVSYSSALASTTGGIVHGPQYNLVTSGTTSTAGLLDEVGGIDTDQVQPSPHGAEVLLFSVPMHADALGQLNLIGDLADATERKTLLWESVVGAPLADIQFVGGSIVIAAPTGQPTLTTIATLAGASEDSDFTISYATLAAAANEADPNGDPISFRIESVVSGTLTKDGTPIVPGTTLLSAGESLVWTPAQDANGVQSSFTVKAFDGTQASSTAVPVMVSVTAVNDAPAFAAGADQWVNATGAHTLPAWATGISPGAANEAGQVLTFQVSTDNDALFSVLPAIDSQGQLTYTLAAGAKGQAHVNVTLHDDGGTANGGQDTSPAQQFLLTINETSLWQNPVNRLDVDQNTFVQPHDSLLVINDLLENGGHALPEIPSGEDVPPPFLDVDGNGFVYPFDALLIINWLLENPPQANVQIAPANAGTEVAPPTAPLAAPAAQLADAVFAAAALQAMRPAAPLGGTASWQTTSADEIGAWSQSAAAAALSRDRTAGDASFDQREMNDEWTAHGAESCNAAGDDPAQPDDAS